MKQKSLRQLARELGVSHSYLSQVKHGKRPASKKVVSTLCNMVSNYNQSDFDLKSQNSYNLAVLGNRLVVGQRTLDP